MLIACYLSVRSSDFILQLTSECLRDDNSLIGALSPSGLTEAQPPQACESVHFCSRLFVVRWISGQIRQICNLEDLLWPFAVTAYSM